MSHVAEWTVKLFLFDDDSVNARAELHTGTHTLVGLGNFTWSRGQPAMTDVRAEVAVSRALVSLAERLKHEAEVNLASSMSHAVPDRRRPGDLSTADT